MYQRGDTIGDYVVEKQIGQGSVATVYRVRHKARCTIHAAKVVTSTVVSARQRFLQEGRIQALLRHPNVVGVTDVVPVDGAMALVMEYVAGPDLGEWLERNEPDLEEALELFAGIVRGVALVHAQGAVHRDLKPSNILLAPSDRGLVPKLADFGLVLKPAPDEQQRWTLHGAFLGSPAYMAPEQIRDPRNVDHRADLWSLGCVLYELVCHRRAFPGSNNVEVADRVVEGRYVPAHEGVPGLPQSVRAAIEGLLRTEPEDRLPSCEALWDVLFEGERGPLEPGRRRLRELRRALGGRDLHAVPVRRPACAALGRGEARGDRPARRGPDPHRGAGPVGGGLVAPRLIRGDDLCGPPVAPLRGLRIEPDGRGA